MQTYKLPSASQDGYVRENFEHKDAKHIQDLFIPTKEWQIGLASLEYSP